MSEFGRSKNQITFIYLSDSIRAKKALAYSRSAGIPIRDIDISKTILTGTQIAEIASNLGLRISELINQNHPTYVEKHAHLDLVENDWIKMIQHEPEIMKQPIAMRGEECVLIESPTDILRLTEPKHNYST